MKNGRNRERKNVKKEWKETVRERKEKGEHRDETLDTRKGERDTD